MYMDRTRAKITASAMAVCFLCIHLLMINIFQQCHVTPMVRFNIFSIVFYLAIQWVVYKDWLQFYAVAVYLEVAVHMALAVIYTGWDGGFQVTLIGMNVLAFYAEYVGRKLKIRYVPMWPIGVLGMVLYIASFIYIDRHPAPYELSHKAVFGLTIVWAVIVFVLNIVVLQMFVVIVSSSEEKLEHQMSHDKLTGLPNRYYMSTRLKEVEGKKGWREYWIAIADIDDFKKVNDTYGHNCGDYVLQTVAALIGQGDTLCCRWGGEEFIFMGETAQNAAKAYSFLDETRKKVEGHAFHFEQYDFNVTMTFGMTTFTAGSDVDAAISEADARLYEGKKSGKNRVVWE